MSTLFVTPFVPALGVIGQLLPGAKMAFYETGTTTLATVYDDDGDPISQAPNIHGTVGVEADISGRFPAIYLDDETIYRVILRTATGALVPGGDVDPYNALSALAQLGEPHGGSLVRIQQAGAGAVPLTVEESILFYPYTLEQFGGGTSEAGFAAADNDTAWAAIKALIGGSNPKSVIQFGSGTYPHALAFDLPTTSDRILIIGMGKGRTILQATGNNQHGIVIPATGTPHSITLKDFSVYGTGTAGTGNGLHHAGVNQFFGLFLENIGFQLISNEAVHCPSTAFTAKFLGVDVGNVSSGHGFNVGGNSLMFDTCYVHHILTANKAAYRVVGATVVFLNCNGVDSSAPGTGAGDSDIWADIGSSTNVAYCPDGVADAGTSPCFATFIGTNIEAYKNIGVNVRSGGVNFLNTSFVDNTLNGNTSVRIVGDFSNGQIGLWDRTIFGTGAAFDNGVAVHSYTPNVPAVIAINRNNLPVSVYDRSTSTTVTLSTIGAGTVATGRNATVMNDLSITGMRRVAYSGTATFTAGAATISFAGLGLANLPNNSFKVHMTRRGATGAANPMYWSAPLTTGFTGNSNSGADTGSFDWELSF